MSISEFLARIAEIILNPLIVFGFAVAFLFFFWGIFSFVASQDDSSARDKGKEHMKWGLIGLIIMISVFGIINLILNTFGLRSSQPQYIDRLLD